MIIERFLEVLEKARAHDGSWSWVFNTRCKYVTVRVDMRTGDCIFSDRAGAPVTLDDILKQHRTASQSSGGQ